jgi:hypothetical protein
MHIAIEFEQDPAESASLALARLLDEHEQQLAAIEREKNAEVVALSAEIARLEAARPANEDLARMKGKARDEKLWAKAMVREEKRLFKQERKCDKKFARIEKESAKEFAKQEKERFKGMADRGKELSKERKEREKELAKTMKEKDKEIARRMKEKKNLEKALVEFSTGMEISSRSETREMKTEARQERRQLKRENKKAARAERCAGGGAFGHDIGSWSGTVLPGWEEKYARELQREKGADNGQSGKLAADEPEALDTPPAKHDAPPPYMP